MGYFLYGGVYATLSKACLLCEVIEGWVVADFQARFQQKRQEEMAATPRPPAAPISPPAADDDDANFAALREWKGMGQHGISAISRPTVPGRHGGAYLSQAGWRRTVPGS